MLSKLTVKMAHWNKTFLGLIVFTFLLNLPYFLNLAFYRHDSFSFLTTFYTAYNNFFYHGEITQWFPYSAYGVNADFIQITLLTVVDYFFIIAGGLLRIKETLLLFKLSLLLEQIIFLMGMYLLAKKLFKHEVTVFFVCACSLGSLVLCDQLFWGFRAFYLLPLMIYYLRLCFEKYRFRYLFIAMNIGVLAMAGSAPYYIVITLLVIFIIVVYLAVAHCRNWEEFLKAKKDHPWVNPGLFLFFLVLLSAYFYVCFCSGEHIRIIQRSGRNIVNYTVSLESFLSYGGDIGFYKFIDFIQPAALHRLWSLDLTLYVGFLALFFIGYSIVKARDVMFYAFVTIVVVLSFFSLGGAVSRILYHIFPGMHYYRHIGLSISCFKVFLPFIAGFGVDAFLRNSRRVMFSCGQWVIVICLLIGAWVFYRGSLNMCGEKAEYLYACFLLFVLFLGMLMLRNFDPKRGFKFMLIAGICIELLGYQAILTVDNHDLTGHWPKGFNRAHKNPFQIARTDRPLDEERRKSFLRAASLSSFTGGTLYAHQNNAFQWDPEVPFLKIDFINAHVARLLEAREANLFLFPFSLPSDANLKLALGCRSPKLKLISQVSFAQDEDEAVNQVKMIENIDEIIVLNNVPSEIQSRWKNYDKVKGASILITGFSNNTLTLDVTLPANSMAWLYYADGFHPSWKAFVNGKSTPIFQANVGFKAILLKGGVSKIRFIYNHSRMIFSFCVLIVAGIIFVLICLFNIGKICFCSKEEAEQESKDGEGDSF